MVGILVQPRLQIPGRARKILQRILGQGGAITRLRGIHGLRILGLVLRVERQGALVVPAVEQGHRLPVFHLGTQDVLGIGLQPHVEVAHRVIKLFLHGPRQREVEINARQLRMLRELLAQGRQFGLRLGKLLHIDKGLRPHIAHPGHPPVFQQGLILAVGGQVAIRLLDGELETAQAGQAQDQIKMRGLLDLLVLRLRHHPRKGHPRLPVAVRAHEATADAMEQSGIVLGQALDLGQQLLGLAQRVAQATLLPEGRHQLGGPRQAAGQLGQLILKLGHMALLQADQGGPGPGVPVGAQGQFVVRLVKGAIPNLDGEEIDEGHVIQTAHAAVGAGQGVQRLGRLVAIEIGARQKHDGLPEQGRVRIVHREFFQGGDGCLHIALLNQGQAGLKARVLHIVRARRLRHQPAVGRHRLREFFRRLQGGGDAVQHFVAVFALRITFQVGVKRLQAVVPFLLVVIRAAQGVIHLLQGQLELGLVGKGVHNGLQLAYRSAVVAFEKQGQPLLIEDVRALVLGIKRTHSGAVQQRQH